MSLAEFDNPPVVETVLAAQFSPLDGFSAAHVGIFAREKLGSGWNRFFDQPRLEDQFERFGDDVWVQPSAQIRVGPAAGEWRAQIVHDDDQRMLQLQNSRFIRNWRRQSSPDYPSYKTLLPEFEREFAAFQAFVAENGWGELLLNQWEVTYVNHIFKRDGLWSSVTDIPKVIPGLYGDWFRTPGVGGVTIQASIVLGADEGRLRIGAKSVRVRGLPENEAIDLRFTARGPITPESSLRDGLNLGHKAIVETFVSLTSDAAHAKWGKHGT